MQQAATTLNNCHTACVCVFMYIYMYVCMYVRTYIRTYIIKDALGYPLFCVDPCILSYNFNVRRYFKVISYEYF